MKLKMTAAAAAFLGRRARRRAELLAEPPLDWGAATVLTVCAPAGGAPAWQVAATACPTANPIDPTPRPALLYAFGPERPWIGHGEDVAGILAALVARALARSATVEVFLAAEALPATECERILAALSTDDVHQVPAGITATGETARFRLDPEAGYAQLAAGLVAVTRPALVDLKTGDITRGRLPLAKCSPAEKRLLGAVALCAQQSRFAAELKPWSAYRPDGTAAAAYAERASSTTIACNSCAMTADNCREERESAATAHAIKWRRDPHEPAAPGLSPVSRTATAALVSPRAMATSASKHELTLMRMASTFAACASAAAAVRSAAA
jgi:hypothetical protein